MPLTENASRKEIATTVLLKELMAAYYHDLDEAAKSGSRKIAWCTSVGPAELLRSMGFLVYFPENHGALLGTTRLAAQMIPYANAIGFSPDICSYLTSDIGSYLQRRTPLTSAYDIQEIPRPDLLVFNTNQCRDVQNWFAWYAREFKAPLAGIYTHRGIGLIREYQIKDIAKQMEDLVPVLEKVSGLTFDLDRFREVVEYSRRTSVLWRACLETAVSIPAPWTFFDMVIHMGPAVVARGTQEAVHYYELLLKELKERVHQGIQAVPNEKFRFYWEGMPIWGKLRSLSELFLSLKTALVASTYCNSWIFDQLDPQKPFESMARSYTELFIVRNDDYKEQYLKSAHDLFKLDGIIFHYAKTCPNNTNNRYGMPDRLSKRLNIPTLVLNGDLNDLRCYSEEQSKTNIEAFIEQLEGP
jgi:benzoyl-CoA reductase/2-hydroxyglutaryl-CoA dehydratase subunit BcrC/BadD/HgdB